ncbi:DUF1758 domain-containing protein [Trichonephila clavipes]|nr:DUF1758 domain-containing protein [Trichonephila clavipes]
MFLAGHSSQGCFGLQSHCAPCYFFNKASFYPSDFSFTDEDFSKPSECDIILGSDCFFSILRNGRITGSKGQPIAQSTIFGWVVAGKIQGSCKTSFMQSHLIRVGNECIDSILQQFWQTEELPLKKISLSEEEEFCENHFKATYKINNEGRFVVKLPVYRDINQLGDTRGSGQILQPDIFTLLVRFRVNEIAFTADIKQILIDPDDQNLQKIVWRKSLDSNIKEYKLSTVTCARGFHLRKWRSNSRDVLINISKNLEFNEPNVEIHPENCSKVLGLIWDSKEDRCIGSSLRLCRLCGAKRSGNYQSCDVGRKSKKSLPLKPICIPRLELNGALLLARFFETLCNCLKDHVINIYAWTDSQVVLSWLSCPPRNWKPFVANRTSEILDIIPCKQWRYVPSKENPADLGSRGMSPKDLPDCSLWWEGPQWLSSEEAWSKQPTIKDKRDIEKFVIIETKRTFVFSVYCKNDIIDMLFDKHSSFSKIIHILAFCLRFMQPCKDGKNKKRSRSKMKLLTTKEVIVARNMVILYVQNVYFYSETKCFKLKKSLPRKTPLAALCLFIDENGLIRVGGMLQNAQLQFRSNMSKQRMGDLPKDRVTLKRPFYCCGIDYAGPVSVLKYRGRGAKTTKGYIVIFVCFATKALHLELVSGYTSETFIAALKRITNEEKVCYFLSQQEIEWHTIPPLSPHFGGLWEAGVKSVKFHLKRVVGSINLTFEEFYTLLTQIEAVLNLRPLLRLVDNDIDSLNVLTPSHFLVGEEIIGPPETVEESKLTLKGRWDIVQKLKLNFWKRWQIDYKGEPSGKAAHQTLK